MVIWNCGFVEINAACGLFVVAAMFDVADDAMWWSEACLMNN